MRDHDWTECLVGFACFGVGAFMVLDRLVQRRKQPASADSTKACVETSLNQVNHQIWLLRNVFWTYLLPTAAPLGVSICYSTWRAHRFGLAAMIGDVTCVVIVTLLYWGNYWLNQFAVQKDLEPRRQELESLLASLQ